MLQRESRHLSLRSILIVWFIVFSIVPLGLVAGYSLIKFQKAIESEQIQRLKANGREIEVIISDYYNQLKNNRDALSSSPQFTYNLAINDRSMLKDIVAEWLNNSILSSLSVYDRDGILLSEAEKNDKGEVKFSALANARIVLNSQYLTHLSTWPDLGIVGKDSDEVIELVLFSKITNTNKRTIGYVEQKISLQIPFLVRIKNRLKLDVMLLNSQKKIVASTLFMSDRDFKNVMDRQGGNFFSPAPATDRMYDIKNRGSLFGFILYPIVWDKSEILFAIGTNKDDSQTVLKNVNVAFIGVISLVVLFLIVTILISTSLLLRPINELIDGLKAFEQTDKPVQLRVKNKTEIGLLTSTFNQMSLKIFQARQDLRKKIKELEKANSNLKEAQAQLVHSAKMTSLGQLVAGVAHELNNPIGFIYSNTTYLKEYSEKLFKIIEEVEKTPDQIDKIKLKYEFDYIHQDLPRLIKSCQDGAQRTRDIVLGLRNFSRIDESQLKEIDIHEALDTTFELLKGEINNRIKVNRQYESIPRVFCYASQINQVLMNLLSNSVHAIQGNGQIWISTTALRASEADVGRVQISIQDSGVGMSAEVIDKIFEPFFTTKEVGKGTGLGLSISYGIIQNHGGDIQVRSQIGVGTEFIVTIPITQKSRA